MKRRPPSADPNITLARELFTKVSPAIPHVWQVLCSTLPLGVAGCLIAGTRRGCEHVHSPIEGESPYVVNGHTRRYVSRRLRALGELEVAAELDAMPYDATAILLAGDTWVALLDATGMLGHARHQTPVGDA